MTTAADPIPASAWGEWQRICALAGCGPGVRAQLERFAHRRFRCYVDRLTDSPWGDVVGPLQASVGPSEAWHLFESHLEIKHTRQGKRYKDWLFARVPLAGGPVEAALEGGATLIIRDVVREHVRREWHGRRQASLHSPIPGREDDGLTMQDLLPAADDTHDALARREYRLLAARLADEWFERLPLRVRVAVCAKSLGQALSEPRVVAAAGCGKSVLIEAYTRYRLDLKTWFDAQHADEGHAGLTVLRCQTALEIQERAYRWARTQSACAPLFAERHPAAPVESPREEALSS